MALWHVAFCCVVPWIIYTMEASRDLCHTTNAHSIGNITISYNDPQTHLSCWIKGNPHSHKELLGKNPAVDLAQKKNKLSFLFNVTNPSWTSVLYCSHGQAEGLGAGTAPAEGQRGAGWWEAMEGSWMMLNVFPSGEPKSLRSGRIMPPCTVLIATACPCGFSFTSRVWEVPIFLLEHIVKISRTDYIVLLKNSFCRDQFELNLRGIAHYPGIRLIFQTDC